MSEKINDGGPAFPYSVQRLQSSYQLEIKGMSLRDWLAGQALTTIPYTAIKTPDDVKAVGKWCYGIADSVLAAKNKGI